jgi:hypothetical protein
MCLIGGRQLRQASCVTHPVIVGGHPCSSFGAPSIALGPPQFRLYQRAYAGQLTESARWPYCVAPL